MKNITIVVLLVFVILMVVVSTLPSFVIEDTVVVVSNEFEEPYIDNSILDYDFSPTVYEIPPRYNKGPRINPFLEVERDKPKIVKIVKVVEVKKEKIIIPQTPLTRWVLTQLNLTGVVITSKSTLAFFTGPNNGRAYTGKIGDHIGRSGIKIANITTGVVHLSNGSKLVVNK
jgi:hypothetical protein